MDDAPESRPVKNLEYLIRAVRRREDRRRPVRRAGSSAADVRRGHRRHRIPAHGIEEKGQGRQAARRRRRQGRAESAVDRPALAAGKALRAGPSQAAGDDDFRREWRRQDHHHRQAGQAHAIEQAVRAAGRGRHLPRRRARAADGLGRAQQRHRHLAGIGRPGRRGLRLRAIGQSARHRRGHGRHGRPLADAVAPDGRVEENQARDRQGHGRRAA